MRLEYVETIFPDFFFNLTGCNLEVLLKGLKAVFMPDSEFFKTVDDYSVRVEFQGRGTLHVHVCVWCTIQESLDQRFQGVHLLQGKSKSARSSALVKKLESMFAASVDVQVDDGTGHAMLTYVTGYATKAADSLQFKSQEYAAKSGQDNKWLCTYRLLSKRSLLEPELVLDMATLPMIVHTFLSETLFAPIPDPSKPVSNDSRKLYMAYLRRGATLDAYSTTASLDMTFIEFVRLFKLDGNNHGEDFKVKVRVTGRGKQAKKNTVAIGIGFAWELLDIYIGQFCAMFIVHSDPNEFMPAIEVPDGSKFLYGALHSKAVQKSCERHCSETKQQLSVFDYLLRRMLNELTLRGAKEDRKKTFEYRLQAMRLFQDHFEKGNIDLREWSTKKLTELPHRHWSMEQQAFLSAVQEGLSVSDANNIDPKRFLFLSGEPGSGKTEVILYAADQTAKTGGKVLIGCPTGSLVSTYRDRLPGSDSIAIETIHSAFAIRRNADAATHDAPSRLRQFDLFILDESSQIEDEVFTLFMMCVMEMSHQPFVVLAGDFAQLQPVSKRRNKGETSKLQNFISGVKTITLQAHEYARSKDPLLMDFLSSIRTTQPTREALRKFFDGKHLKQDLDNAIGKSINLEDTNQKPVTWLTVTNKGAAKVNQTMLSRRYSLDPEFISQRGYPGDVKAGADRLVIQAGMRLRLTRNLDKDRGFVNGAIGIVTQLLDTGGKIFLMRLTHGAMVLVHPIHAEGETFLPCAYGYAMTIRLNLSR